MFHGHIVAKSHCLEEGNRNYEKMKDKLKNRKESGIPAGRKDDSVGGLSMVRGKFFRERY